MKITTKILKSIAQDFVDEQVASGEKLVAAYLTGSSLKSDFLIEGTTDIDIVLIKDIDVEKREIKKLSSNIHLDIISHPKKYYQPPKYVRTHPFYGPAINSCISLYDENHFIGFTQAGVRSEFISPKNSYERSHGFLKEARQLWLSLELKSDFNLMGDTLTFIKSINLLSKAFIICQNKEVSIRRLLPTISKISQEIEFPALPIGIMGLIGANQIDTEKFNSWTNDWEIYLKQVSSEADCPPKFHVSRIEYYKSGIVSCLSNDDSFEGLWVLLNTLLDAYSIYPTITSKLPEILNGLSFSKSNFNGKLKGLDSLLEQAEEWFDKWKFDFGL